MGATAWRPKLILASCSPRRRELLAGAGYSFEVYPPTQTAERGPWSGEGPARCGARLAPQTGARVDVTTLRMDPLTRAEIDDYLAGSECEGKAGAFGYQDRLGWVHVVEGS